MTKKELDYFKNLILKKQAKILLDRSRLYNDDRVNPIGESHYSLHLADQGSDTMDHELGNYFNHRQLKYLKNLNLALDRLQSGQYGKCIVCKKNIRKMRLEAVPHTRHCAPCKSLQFI